ncbi:rab-GTPase-TBC domain-containing protein [Zopfochytrium polystomum]|nr:rab-GTPase-TBC domain-containing protein [Zopfochytrium polystomum]
MGEWNGAQSGAPSPAAAAAAGAVDGKGRLRRSVSSSPIYSPVRRKKPELGPIVRDKYGFRRSFEYISKEDQDAFDAYYAGVCERRRQKWDVLLRKCGGVMPPRSDRSLKRYIRKGIPHELRIRCWLHYSGANKDMEENPGLYTMLSYREQQDRSMGYRRDNNKILEHIEVLDKDLHRTFPDNIHFHGGQPASVPETPTDGSGEPTSPTAATAVYMRNPYLRSLRRILTAFAYYSWPHPNETRTPPRVCSYPIGYCQSLNFLVGLLLLVDGQTSGENGEPGAGNGAVFGNIDHPNWERVAARIEERAFWLLVAIVERLLPPEMYGANLEGAQIAQEILWKWLLGERGGRFGVNKVAKWVDGMEGSDLSSRRRAVGIRSKSRSRMQPASNSSMPPLSMVTTSWFMTIYVNILPIETVLRVWDCFFFQGEKVLMRVTLTLLKIHEDQVLACNDTSDAWKLIKEIPPRMIDCHRLMEICFKPRVSLNPFDERGGQDPGTVSPPHAYITPPAAAHSSSAGSSPRRSTTGDDSDDEVGMVSPVIQNDPLRKYGEGAANARRSKVPRRGVGSVSRKMIAHYRSLALQERHGGERPSAGEHRRQF